MLLLGNRRRQRGCLKVIGVVIVLSLLILIERGQCRRRRQRSDRTAHYLGEPVSLPLSISVPVVIKIALVFVLCFRVAALVQVIVILVVIAAGQLIAAQVDVVVEADRVAGCHEVDWLRGGAFDERRRNGGRGTQNLIRPNQTVVVFLLLLNCLSSSLPLQLSQQSGQLLLILPLLLGVLEPVNPLPSGNPVGPERVVEVPLPRLDVGLDPRLAAVGHRGRRTQERVVAEAAVGSDPTSKVTAATAASIKTVFPVVNGIEPGSRLDHLLLLLPLTVTWPLPPVGEDVRLDPGPLADDGIASRLLLNLINLIHKLRLLKRLLLLLAFAFKSRSREFWLLEHWPCCCPGHGWPLSWRSRRPLSWRGDWPSTSKVIASVEVVTSVVLVASEPSSVVLLPDVEIRFDPGSRTRASGAERHKVVALLWLSWNKVRSCNVILKVKLWPLCGIVGNERTSFCWGGLKRWRPSGVGHKRRDEVYRVLLLLRRSVDDCRRRADSRNEGRNREPLRCRSRGLAGWEELEHRRSRGRHRSLPVEAVGVLPSPLCQDV